MNTFLDFLIEASKTKARSKSSNNYLSLASNTSTTDELRNLVDTNLTIKKTIPKISKKNPGTFVKEYNRLLKNSKHAKDIKTIFDIVPKGVGPGEILLSYLSDNIAIGGGTSNFDIKMGNHNIEVKATKVDTEGWAYNFRLGVDSRAALSAAIKDLKDLYNSAKYHISEINNDDVLNKIDRGEMTSLKKYLKPFNPSVATNWEKLPLSIFKNGDIYFKGEKIGDVSSKKVLSVIKELLLTQTKKIKSFVQIEADLSDKLSMHKLEYFFFDIDTKELYYKSSFPKSVIDTITGGSIKVKSKLF
jgi:hypothetical protein